MSRNLLHLPTSVNSHQDTVSHILVVHQWRVCLMHNLIRDYILQILFVFYEKTLFKKRENKKNDISTVWILVGILDNGKKVCEQVGRTKDIINSLTEIKDNVKDFYRSDSKKYGTLKDKNYYVS